MTTNEALTTFRDLVPIILSIGLPTWIYKVLKPQINELKKEVAEVKADKDKWYSKYTTLISELLMASKSSKCTNCKMLETLQNHLKDERKQS